MEWAKNQYGDEGTAIGVVYELGTCLDLLDSNCIQLLKIARSKCEKDMLQLGQPLPKNAGWKLDLNKDRILRYMDCAVINYLTTRTGAHLCNGSPRCAATDLRFL